MNDKIKEEQAFITAFIVGFPTEMFGDRLGMVDPLVPTGFQL
jgi:hypothetical protein